MWRPASNRSGGSTRFDQGGLEGGGSLQLSDWSRGEGWEEGPDRAIAIDMMIKGGLERRMQAKGFLGMVLEEESRLLTGDG